MGTTCSTVIPSATSWRTLSGLFVSSRMRGMPDAAASVRRRCSRARPRPGPCGVRLVCVQALILQRVGVELGIKSDAASLLAEVEECATLYGEALHGLAQLGTAVAALRAEDIAGQALAVQPHRGAAASPAGAAFPPKLSSRCSASSTR